MYFGTLICIYFSFLLCYFIKTELASFFIYIVFFFFLQGFSIPLRENAMLVIILSFWLISTATLLFLSLPLRILSSIVSFIFLALLKYSVSLWNQPSYIMDISVYSGFILFFIFMHLLCWWLILFNDRVRKLQSQIKTLELSTDQLVKANIGFQQYAAIVSKDSILNERKRISREIHDSVGHKLVNLIMMLQESVDCLDQKVRLKGLITDSRIEARDALDSTRRAVRMFREKIPQRSLSLMLNDLSSTFQNATGINVDLELGNITNNLDLDFNDNIYSIIQESFTNAIRHGHATEVLVRIWMRSASFVIYISDNGEGSNKIDEGVGLISMKERIAAMGADISFNSIKGEGFSIKIEIPLTGNQNE